MSDSENDMEQPTLRDFVARALVDLVAGVMDAQVALGSGAPDEDKKAGRAVIAPPTATPHGSSAPHQTFEGGMVWPVEFDVQVGVTVRGSGHVSGGLRVMALGSELGKEHEQSESSTSRIRFSVPIVWPTRPLKRDPSIVTAGGLLEGYTAILDELG